MSTKPMITSSEITYVLVIHGIVECSRALEPSLCSNLAVGVRLLCWLDESITSYSALTEYYCMDDMYDNLVMNVMECGSSSSSSSSGRSASPSSSTRMPVIEYAFDMLRGTDDSFLFSIDSLLELVETTKGLFQENPATANVNGCPGPTKVCADSFLGIFLRSFLAKFDSLSFESICTVYENLVNFTRRAIAGLRSKTAILKIEEAYRAFDKVIGIDDNVFASSHSSVNSPVLHLLNSMRAISLGDVTAAESELHKYFDYNATDLIKANLSQQVNNAVGPDGKSTVVEMSVAEAVSQLKAANSQPLFAGHRHQQAMLSLARMWSENRQFGLALGAVEEAMKISHNRGDHKSVAGALLLIHEIASLSRSHYLQPAASSAAPLSGSSRVDVTMEEVLLRCIDRCAEMGIGQMAAQSAVRLAKLCAEKPLNPSSGALARLIHDSSDSATGGKGTDLSSPSGGRESERSVATIWTILACAQIGECYPITQIALNGHIVDPTGMAFTPNANLLGLPASKDASRTDNPLSAADSFQLGVEASIVAIDFWARLNVPAMALLQCRRAMCLFGASGVASSYDIVHIVCSFAKILVRSEINSAMFNSISSDSGGTITDRAAITDACDKSLRLLNKLGKLYKSKFPQSIRTEIDAAILFVKIHKNTHVDKDPPVSALGMSIKLLEMSYPLAFSRYNSSGACLSSGDVKYLVNLCSSPCAADIWFLYASVLEKINPLESLTVLRCLQSSLADRGFLELSLQAAVLCERCVIANDISIEMSHSLVRLKDIYFLSNRYCYHLVESTATWCIFKLFHERGRGAVNIM